MTTTQSPRIKNPKLAKPTAAQIDPFARALPVAEPKQVWAHTKWVLRRHKGQLSLVLILHSFAAVAALAMSLASVCIEPYAAYVMPRAIAEEAFCERPDDSDGSWA